MTFLKYLQEETTAGDIAAVPQKLNFREDSDLNDIFDDLLYVYLAYKDCKNFNELISNLINEYYDLNSDDDTPSAVDDFINNEQDDLTFNVDDLTEIVVDLLENGVEPEEILDVLDLDDNLNNFTEEEYFEFIDYLDDFIEYLDEAVSNKFTNKSFNKKRRKFFSKTKAQFRRDKPQRKRANRTNKINRQRYYRRNKVKIKRYNQQYRKAVKTGKHIKKVRR